MDHASRPERGTPKQKRDTGEHSGTAPGAPHVITSTPTGRTIVKGVLPFTGLGLTLFLVIALALVGLGAAVRFGGGKEVTAA
jgi:hypothetical protein